MATLADVLRQTGYTPDGNTPTDSPMTKVLAEHIKSIPQKFAQNQQAQMDLLGKAFPGNTYESMMTQGDPKALAELAMQVPFNAMVAYHGTPHKIVGNFDINKVGTGEGAQAYGHGMYFAEAPSVAESYKTKLSGGLGSPSNELLVNGQPLTNLTDAQRRAYEIVARDGRKNALGTAKDLEAEGFDASHIREALKATKGKNISLTKNEGNLYKVDIPDEYIPNMLDWDKPLSQQPKAVQQALAKIDPDSYSSKGIDYDPTELGQAIYHRLMNSPLAKNDVEASALLNKSGISGIRYLDQGSRTGGGTSNFVVFDPSEVKILEKNSKPVSRKELIEEQVNKLEDYRGSHTAPNAKQYGGTLDALENIMPADVYGSKGIRLYGIGDPEIDRQWFAAAYKAKGNPDAMVDVYRAVPKGVKDINHGDWVTTSKKYAENHGENSLNGEYEILSKKVKASTLSSEGYPYEFGYHE